MHKIKSGTFSRGFAIARLTVSAGARAAGHAVGNLFGDESSKDERLKLMLQAQFENLARELGSLKGTLMKAGQMLSMYGEHFFPPEVNALLKSLQSQSPPLEWRGIEKVLSKQLGPEKLAELEIETHSLASASLGQVHLATRKSDGRRIALKIQYPGVDAAIESDLRALRSILSMAKVIPGGPRYDSIFAEVRQMMHHEVDYRRELDETRRFRELLRDDPRYVIPEPLLEYSTGRVLATSYEPGLEIDSPEVKALSQERRNALGVAALELYLRELLVWGRMQTDPHFGNYRVRISGDGARPDQLVLYDFGAVRKLDRKFLEPYRELIAGTFFRDRPRLIRAAIELGFLREEDSEQYKTSFAEISELFLEPFSSDGIYDWSKSDLPQRVTRKGAEMIWSAKLRPPPREVVFLDRKMGGVFILLSALGAKIRSRELLEKYFNQV